MLLITSSLIKHKLSFIKLKDYLKGCGLCKVLVNPNTLDLKSIFNLLNHLEGYIQYDNHIFHFNKQWLCMLPQQQSEQLNSIIDHFKANEFRLASEEEISTFSHVTGNTHLNGLPISEWTQGEWGYIRGKGVTFRGAVMHDMKECIYIGLLASQPVAMFVLDEHLLDVSDAQKQFPVSQLMYVFIEKNYRGFGFGKQILDEAKKVAYENGAQFFHPGALKSVMEVQYSKMLCGQHFFSHPLDVSEIPLLENKNTNNR